MSKILLIIGFLKGKKTYFLMAIAILTAIVGVLDGSLTVVEFLQSIFVAFGVITTRAGINSLGK